jgi:hypothetical protein
MFILSLIYDSEDLALGFVALTGEEDFFNFPQPFYMNLHFAQLKPSNLNILAPQASLTIKRFASPCFWLWSEFKAE